MTGKEIFWKGLLFALGLGGLALWAGLAHAQSMSVSPCTQITNSASGIAVVSCAPVTATAPLPVTGIGGTVTASGTATTAAPSYTNGSTDPLSMDLAGNLRVMLGLPLPAGTAIIGKIDIDQTTPGTTNGVQLTAGTALAGKVGIDQTTVGSTNAVTQIPSAVTAVGIASVKSAAAEASHVIKASAGNLYGFSVTSGATPGYALVLNATSDPGNGAATPIKCYALPASSTLAVSFGNIPGVFSTGIVIVFSTTGCFTETQSATAFISGDAS